MQAVIISPRTPHHYAPLNTGRELGECLIANVPLYTLIASELEGAGFEVISEADADTNTVILPLDHWVEVGALCILANETEPTTLVNSNDEVIAWIGAETPEQCKGKITTEAPCFDITYSWDLLRLNEDVLNELPGSEILGEVSKLSEVNGTLYLGKGSTILPGVYIEGNVVIGENCQIGPNAYIGGNTAIGDHCLIGNAVEVNNSIINSHCSISHLSYVGNSILGYHVNLGAGTIISDTRHDARKHQSLMDNELLDTGRDKLGAIIGDGVQTGINTSVYPGRKIGRGRTTRPGTNVTNDLM